MRIKIRVRPPPNQACNTYQKLYDQEAYNSKARADLEKKHAGKRTAAKDTGEEYCNGKKNMKGNSVIPYRALAASAFTPYYFQEEIN